MNDADLWPPPPVRGAPNEPTPLHPICTGCNRRPAEIDVYIELAAVEETTPDEWVRREEGTLNPRNGHFLCDPCYVKAGMPVGPHGWVAP